MYLPELKKWVDDHNKKGGEKVTNLPPMIPVEKAYELMNEMNNALEKLLR